MVGKGLNVAVCAVILLDHVVNIVVAINHTHTPYIHTELGASPISKLASHQTDVASHAGNKRRQPEEGQAELVQLLNQSNFEFSPLLVTV